MAKSKSVTDRKPKGTNACKKTSGAGTGKKTVDQTSNNTQFEQQVLELVNQERSNAGLNSLSMNSELSKTAMVKAQDMYNNNYFDHNSPSYGSSFDMMKQFGIVYSSAGENIAKPK